MGLNDELRGILARADAMEARLARAQASKAELERLDRERAALLARTWLAKALEVSEEALGQLDVTVPNPASMTARVRLGKRREVSLTRGDMEHPAVVLGAIGALLRAAMSDEEESAI